MFILSCLCLCLCLCSHPKHDEGLPQGAFCVCSCRCMLLLWIRSQLGSSLVAFGIVNCHFPLYTRPTGAQLVFIGSYACFHGAGHAVYFNVRERKYGFLAPPVDHILLPHSASSQLNLWHEAEALCRRGIFPTFCLPDANMSYSMYHSPLPATSWEDMPFLYGVNLTILNEVFLHNSKEFNRYVNSRCNGMLPNIALT